MKQAYLILSMAVSVILCSMVDASASDLGDGLVANYPFSGNANDASGNGYDGTVGGATLTLDRFGNPDSAYYFDGVNDQIALPISGPLDIERTDPISKSFWIKTSSSSSQSLLLSKKGVGNRTLRGISTEIFSGRIVFRMVHDAFVNTKLVVSGVTTVNDGEWHHVAISYDGSSSASGVVMYLDGALEPVNVSADSLTGTILNDDIPYIGTLGDRKYYEGVLDEVRLYDRVLSADEVSNLYVIPEPATLGLFGLSGLAFCMFRRMRIF